MLEMIYTRIEEERMAIDRDPAVMARFVREYLRECGGIPSPAELEKVFEYSTALGFTLRQHCAACERLSRLNHPLARDALEEVRGQGLAVGLGTTHLAKGMNGPMQAAARGEDYVINGMIPWTTGYRVFDRLIFGAKLGNTTVIGLIGYPAADSSELKIIPHELSTMQGTSTVAIRFLDYPLLAAAVIDVIRPEQNRVMPPTQYAISDLGMARAALRHASGRMASLSAEARGQILLAWKKLDDRIELLHASLAQAQTVSEHGELIFRKDRLVMQAIVLLRLVSGGRGIIEGDIASALHRESQILDAVIQDPENLRKKCDFVDDFAL